MSVGKLLAMRNAKTIRFNVGRGGIAELTTEVVNGALAQCPNRLGASILECIHSPGASSEDYVARTIIARLIEQRAKRAEAVVNAELAYHFAALGHSTRLTPHEAKGRHEAAMAAAWPRYARDAYERVMKAVLGEIFERSRCPECGGSGELKAKEGAPARSCPVCHGTGRVSLKRHGRAQLMDMHHDLFARRWEPVYDWLLRELTEELRAAEDFIVDYCRARAA